MTREEALEIITNALQSDESNYTEKIDKALAVTQKALEQNPTAKNDLAVDCISRAEVNQVIEDYIDEQYHVLSDRTRERAFGAKAVMARINELPSVTPQEPKTGHWVQTEKTNTYSKWKCSECEMLVITSQTPWYKHCPMCGLKMVEPQESEE